MRPNAKHCPTYLSPERQEKAKVLQKHFGKGYSPLVEMLIDAAFESIFTDMHTTLKNINVKAKEISKLAKKISL